MKLEFGKDVLLFYKKHYWDHLSYAPNRTITGFFSWYMRLVDCLEKEGYRVHQNQYGLAEANPLYPIGIVGTPIAIPDWYLPNPAILGPSMYDHPLINPFLMRDPRFRYYILTCEWLRDVFAKVYGDTCILWHAGIEDDTWVDVSECQKDIDVLIYDKIRWERETLHPLMVEGVAQSLQRRGLTGHILRYGNISQDEYKHLLNRSKSMVFLCEHETQGMAYQEALMSNIPILAWDPGFIADPHYKMYEDAPIPATSVPQFSPQCGERFAIFADFEDVFETFWQHLEFYEPRQFAQIALSPRKSAQVYMQYYEEVYAWSRAHS